MKAEIFLREALKVIINNKELSCFTEPQHRVIAQMNWLIDEDIAEDEKLEKASILLDGFCKAMPESLSIRQELAKVRRERWGASFGFDTVKFMINHEVDVNETSKVFKELMMNEYIKQHELKVTSRINHCDAN